MRWNVTVTIRPKAGLRDPEGATIEEALHALGWAEVAHVHVGRTIAFAVHAVTEDAAGAQVDDMCNKILANPVIEDFDIALARSEE